MIHLIKLSVGTQSVDDLIAWRESRAAAGFGRNDGSHLHRTRMMPKRAAEIIGAGSIYWVIAGAVRCRQTIVGLDAAVDHEGKRCCDIVLAPEIIRTLPWPRRPFQGWRYLSPADAPPDLAEGEEGPPEGMAEELARYGLL